MIQRARLFDRRIPFERIIRWIWRDWTLAPKELMRKHPRKLPCHGSCSTLLTSVGIRTRNEHQKLIHMNSEATSSLEESKKVSYTYVLCTYIYIFVIFIIYSRFLTMLQWEWSAVCVFSFDRIPRENLKPNLPSGLWRVGLKIKIKPNPGCG